MSDAEQISRFCSVLLGADGDDVDDRLSGFRAYLWTIGTDGTKRTRWERADHARSLASAAVELRSRQPEEIAHVYVGTGLLTTRDAAAKGMHRRGTNADTAGLLALVVDIDFLSDVHAAKAYPPDLESARRVWEAVPLRPTMVARTGNGVHVWWCFAEPWLIGDDDDPEIVRAEMYELAQGWSRTMRAHAARVGGWQIDSTFDLARVMRVPGTMNVRNGRTTSSELLEWDPDARYEPDDFREHLLDPTQLEASFGPTAGTLLVGPGGLDGVDLKAVWARVNSAASRERGYTPEWLAQMLEILPGSPLESVWYGHITARNDSSPSGVDAALVAALIRTGHATDERLAEAVMCRRLRSGEGVEKVDPHRRTSYLVSTITRLRTLVAASTDGAEPSAPSVEAATKSVRELRDRLAALPGKTKQPDFRDDFETIALNQIAEVVPPGVTPAPRAVHVPPREVSPADETAVSPPATDETAVPATDETAVPKLDKRPDHFKSSSTKIITDRVGVADLSHDSTLAKPPVKGAPGIWPPRHVNAVAALESLDTVLLHERDRSQGVTVYALEYRDQGENQKGRMVLYIPSSYQWEGIPPHGYRPGRPFYCAWYRRDAFEVPKGYRQSVTRDAQLRALPIAANKELWLETIDLMVPYWQRDSSRSDMASQVHDWLFQWLCDSPASLDRDIAVDRKCAYLLNHAGWGRQGTPKLLFPGATFLEFAGRQPGGVVGRNAKELLTYLRIDPHRLRVEEPGEVSTKRVSGWYRVEGQEFDEAEWNDILRSAYDNAEAIESRKLRAIEGGVA